MKCSIVITLLFLISTVWGQEFKATLSSAFLSTDDTQITFAPVTHNAQNIFMMGGGGGAGGTGYAPPEYFEDLYASNPLFKRLVETSKITSIGGNVVALGGGGGAGGTGHSVDFIIRDGQLIKAGKFSPINGGNVVFRLSDDLLEDIEFKTGEVVLMEDISNALAERSNFATIAVPVEQIESVYMRNGALIEQSMLLEKMQAEVR